MRDAQTAAHILMIRPVRFTANAQTAGSNRFQHPAPDADEGLQAVALAEFDALVSALRSAGVGVVQFEDTLEPHTPDSIFPNNWVSLHADGTAALYPMFAPNRRLERRRDVLQSLVAEHGFRIGRVIDLSHHESAGRYLEGTGSLVLDRVNRVAYACLSARTDPQVLSDFARQLGYELETFHAYDRAGAPIYHTNVMLCVGEAFALMCTDCVPKDERSRLLRRLHDSGRLVLELTYPQLLSFCGNALELRTFAGESVIAMSDRARTALTDDQRQLLESRGSRIVSVPIPTIERIGGGSVRCMLAEIHLPHSAASAIDRP